MLWSTWTTSLSIENHSLMKVSWYDMCLWLHWFSDSDVVIKITTRADGAKAAQTGFALFVYLWAHVNSRAKCFHSATDFVHVCVCAHFLLWYLLHWQPWYEWLLWSSLKQTASPEFLSCCSEQTAWKAQRRKARRWGGGIPVVFRSWRCLWNTSCFGFRGTTVCAACNKGSKAKSHWSLSGFWLFIIVLIKILL